MRWTTRVVWTLAALAAVMLGAPVEAQEGSINGRWKTGDVEFTIEHFRNGTVLLRVDQAGTRAGLVFRGKYDPAGFKVSARLRSVENISPNIPLSVRREILRRHPDVSYTYELKPIDASTIDAVSISHEVKHDRFAQTLTSINFNATRSPFTMKRVTGLPDLVVTYLVCERIKAFENQRTMVRWDIKATIVNDGDADATEAFRVGIYESNVRTSPDGSRPWARVADSFFLQRPLAKGELVTLHWRTDVPLSGRNTPMFIRPDSRTIKLVVDDEDKIDEIHEHNNDKSLERISCAPPGSATAPVLKTLWVPIVEGEPSTIPDYATYLTRLPLRTVDEKTKAVLCYIKVEAERRALERNRTVAGTEFLKNLTDHFLQDYLAKPSPETGKAAALKIGASQGIEGAPKNWWGAGGLYVPKRIRDRHPNVPEWIYPATEFWQLPKTKDPEGAYVGENIDKIPVIDASFLIGTNTVATSGSKDAEVGGRNLSQVMHWATGVRYGNLPAGAFQELFIGYEMWHMEGWDVFGEDAINDLIAEEMGRMLGRRLMAGDIKSSADLVRKMDADFWRARAWAGALLKLRWKELDKLILAADTPKTNTWWGKGDGFRPAPWTGMSIRDMFLGDRPMAQVLASPRVEHLVEMYTLIYEADEASVTPLSKRIVNGDFNAGFKAAPSEFGSKWEIQGD